MEKAAAQLRRGASGGHASSSTQDIVKQIREEQDRDAVVSPVAQPQQGRFPPAMPDLLFVTYKGPAERKSRDLKLVRSHVMLQHVRMKRPRMDRQQEANDEDMAEAKRPKPTYAPETGGIDPFGTLSVTMTRAMSRLFHHYVTTISPLHYPPTRNPECNPMNTRWVSLAIRDPALLQSTLCSAAGHLALLEGRSGPSGYFTQYLIHKTETVRMVNERISDLSLALTDETLAAIALLVTDQVVDGDYKEMAIHMHGLAKLVDLRGGLPAVGMNGLLSGEIQWCDIITAFMTCSVPQLPLDETQGGSDEKFSSSILQRFVSPEHSSDSINVALLESSFTDRMSEELVETFWDMSIMTALLDLKADYSEIDMLVYDRKRASIQHRLARNYIPCSTETTTESKTENENELYIQESCRMAGVIFSNLVMWGFQPPMRFYGDLAIMLQERLMNTDLENNWGGGFWEDFLLWVLVLGGYAALGRPERPWFIGLLSNMVNERRFYGFEDVRVVLARIMYKDCLDDAIKMLLQEVEEFTAQLADLDLRD